MHDQAGMPGKTKRNLKMKKNYTTLNVEQRSPEWHALRKKSIGASDAPIIMGLSKYKTPHQLWSEKLGLTQPDQTNHIQQHGIDNEEEARQAFEKQTGILVEPSVVVSNAIPWMIASLDGLSVCESILVEIKCPYGDSVHDSARTGAVGKDHFCQIQHQLAVTGLKTAYFYSYKNGTGYFVVVDRDDAYIETLIAELKKFKKMLDNLEEPELLSKDYLDMSTSPEWESSAQELIAVREKMADLQAVLDPLVVEEKRLQSKIQELAGESSAIGCGVKCTRFLQKGVIDYKAVKELKGVDLEPYRKEKTVRYRLTLTN